MKLVKDVKKSLRWFSVQAMAVGMALQGAWLILSDDLKSRVSDDLATWVTVAILVLAFVGRITDQGGGDA